MSKEVHMSYIKSWERKALLELVQEIRYSDSCDSEKILIIFKNISGNHD